MRRLAHELNGLLDGSMRCLRLAERALSGAGDAEAGSVEEALQRLHSAQLAMGDMAEVLSRAAAAPAAEAELLRADRTLGDAIQQVRASLALMAEQCNVDLRIDSEPNAAALPAGPLQSVLTNTIRNAIEACAEAGLTTRHVTATISINAAASELTILVADTGHGLDREPEEERSTKPHGHGLGLGVCREIVSQLGGRMGLTNAPFGRGAVLEVVVPVASLRSA